MYNQSTWSIPPLYTLLEDLFFCKYFWICFHVLQIKMKLPRSDNQIIPFFVLLIWEVYNEFKEHWMSVQSVKKPDFFTEEETELILRNLHAHISGYTQVWQATQQNSSKQLDSILLLYMATWRKCYGYHSTSAFWV